MRESSQTVLRHGRAKLSQSSLPLSLWQALPSKEQGGQVFSPQRKIKTWLFGKPEGRVRPKASFECGQHRNPKGCPRPCGVGSYVVHTGNRHSANQWPGWGPGGGANYARPLSLEHQYVWPCPAESHCKSGQRTKPPACSCRRSAGAGRGFGRCPLHVSLRLWALRLLFPFCWA